MKLLFLEIWLYLLLAFLLGMFVQWFFCCRGAKSQNDSNAALLSVGGSNSEESEMAEDAPNERAEISALAKPTRFDSPPSDKDELKRIKGIGAVIEETLNGLGVYTFQQIAEWDEGNVAWVENHLAFPGRIRREKWVSQAMTLSRGGETEFSKRVDDGEVDYR